MSCTAPNRLVSCRAHWSNSLLETVESELYLFQKHKSSSNEFYICARCGRMIIPLNVPLELMFFAVDGALNSYFMIMIMMWQAVLTVLHNILSIGIVTW